MRMIAELPDSLEGYLERASEKGEIEVDTDEVIALDILVPRYYSAEARIWPIMPPIWMNIWCCVTIWWQPATSCTIIYGVQQL